MGSLKLRVIGSPKVSSVTWRWSCDAARSSDVRPVLREVSSVAREIVRVRVNPALVASGVEGERYAVRPG